MKWEEAVKVMKEGKRVRRPNFTNNAYYYNDDGIIRLSSDNEPISPEIFLFEATDWEIVEEKKTLSNKTFHSYNEYLVAKVVDIKAANKEFIEWLNNPNKEIDLDNTCKGKTSIEIKAKEIYGDELIWK